VGELTLPRVPLARLFAMAYRLLVDELHERLAERGWEGVRPAFGFVLLALRDGPASLRDLPGVLGTSKQAVSKLVDAMVEAGYAQRLVDPQDARARRVQLSAEGVALLADVEEIWARLEEGWAQTLGGARLEDLRGDLETVLRATHGGSLPAVRTVG
jgi:DNA-binding MarR family transcriptional regulator